MADDPTKVLDALQDLIVHSRAIEGALPLTAPSVKDEDLRVALAAAERVIGTQPGARVDHLRRIETRGPGPQAVPLGRYHMELIHPELADPSERLRVWQGGHLMAEIELSPGSTVSVAGLQPPGPRGK